MTTRSGPTPLCGRLPWGLLGMLALVAAAESRVGLVARAAKWSNPQTSVMNRLPGTSPLRFQPFVEGVPAAHVIFE